MNNESNTIEVIASNDCDQELTLMGNTGSSLDYNDSLRLLISKSLGKIPEVGTLLSAITSLLWPKSKEDIWADIKKKVEALIDEKLDKELYNRVQESLKGIKSNLDYFLDFLNQPSEELMAEKLWVELHTEFNDQQYHFQSHGHKILLLPLFVQFANLQLAVLRDGVIHGESWGWSQYTQDKNAEELQDKITEYETYVEDNVKWKIDKIKKHTDRNKHNTEPFYAANKYERNVTFNILDFKNMWKYFDTKKYPKPVDIVLDREIYTNPHGTADDSGLVKKPSPPTKPIKEVIVWGWDRIDAVEVYYPEGGGPHGKTSTGRMGDQDGGSDKKPHGGKFPLDSKRYITCIEEKTGTIVDALRFHFNDGKKTNWMGGGDSNAPDTKGHHHQYSYPHHMVSSIKINGISNYYGSADLIFFGFKFIDNIKPDTDTIKTLYVSSPTELDEKSLSKIFDEDETDKTKSEIKKLIEKENWKSSRDKYWAV